MDIPLLKQKGFILNPFTNRYETSRFRVASSLRSYFKPCAEKLFKSTTVEILCPWTGVIRLPPTKTLTKYQRLGVRNCMERNHYYIAFEQGLGKTPTGAAIINSVGERTLIITPPDLDTNWLKHLAEWSIKPLRVCVITGKDWDEKWLKKHDVVICPDTLIDRYEIEETLRLIKWGLILIEEADRFSTPNARRSHSVFGDVTDGPFKKEPNGLCHLADKVVCFSGTPMRNRPIEMFGVLSSLALNLIDYRDRLEYGVRYCAGYESAYGWNFNGASNAEEWRRKIMNTFLQREEQQDHIKVKKKKQIVYFKNKLKPTTLELERAIMKDMKISDFIKGYDELKNFSANKQLGAISRYRKDLSKLKIYYAASHVKKALDETKGAVLLLGYHETFVQDVAYALRHYHPLVIQGKTPHKVRMQRIEAIQRGQTRLLVAQLLTMVGHNIDACKRVVFGEFDWSKRNNDQAMDRPFRFTQQDDVMVDILVIENTLEEYVLNSVLKKNKTVDSFINKKRKGLAE